MTKPLSPAAQAVVDAWNAKHNPYGLTYLTHAPEREALAAALRAVADQVAPVRAWHESDNDAAWERHQMSVIIRRRILIIADELEAQP